MLPSMFSPSLMLSSMLSSSSSSSSMLSSFSSSIFSWVLSSSMLSSMVSPSLMLSSLFSSSWAVPSVIPLIHWVVSMGRQELGPLGSPGRALPLIPARALPLIPALALPRIPPREPPGGHTEGLRGRPLELLEGKGDVQGAGLVETFLGIRKIWQKMFECGILVRWFEVPGDGGGVGDHWVQLIFAGDGEEGVEEDQVLVGAWRG
jgi:hypothetical protein